MRISSTFALTLMLAALTSSWAAAAQVAPTRQGRPVQTVAPAQPTPPVKEGSKAVVTTGIKGSVMRGPVRSIGGSVAVPKATLIVSPPGEGQQVATMSTDETGKFELSLPPGTYVVTLGSQHDFMFTKELPATIVVTAGKVTPLNVLLDTGIR